MTSKKGARLTWKSISKEVEEYQLERCKSLTALCVDKAVSKYLGRQPSIEEVVFLTGIHRIYKKNGLRPGHEKLKAPASLLWKLMTGLPTEMYKGMHSVPHQYMAKITKTVIEPLVQAGLLFVESKSEDSCRGFYLSRDYWDEYKAEQRSWAFATNPSNDHKERLLKMAPKSSDFYKKGLHPYTLGTLERMRKSQFRFNSQKYFSDEKLEIFEENRITDDQIEALNYSVVTIYRKDDSPQYHEQFFLQNSGRMHTHGGPLFMPSWFRYEFIKPVVKGNYLVEADLKSAHLLILCDLFGLKVLKNDLLEEITLRGSIWSSIGKGLPKNIKKKIVYSFCYGCDYKSIPYQVNLDLPQDQRVFLSDVDSCLKGLLSPLVEARDNWLKEVIIPKKPINKLGYRFKANPKDNPKKVAAKYLAHLAQGEEQFVIQNLIANILPPEINIVCFQYDGFTFESSKDQVEILSGVLRDNSQLPLEFEVIYPTLEMRLLEDLNIDWESVSG